MKNIENAVFLGSKKFGLQIFKALYAASSDVKWTILCPPDLDDIRTHYDEFLEYAKSNNLDLSVAVSPEMVTQYVIDHQPDVVVVCGYYRILPAAMLEAVPEGVWGIHNSLLPAYRGGSPLVWQLINAEPEIGSSFFRFTDGMDDGPVLHQVRIQNAKKLDIREAMDQLEQAWIADLPEVWRHFCEGKAEPAHQNHSLATYCCQRNELDGCIDWEDPAEKIDCFIRAQAKPYPMAFFKHEEKRIRISKHQVDGRVTHGTPGQVFEVKSDYVSVCCGGNTLIRILQVEDGGIERNAAEILNSITVRLGR